jgi:hypothetical protein
MKQLLTTLVILTGLIGSADAVWADDFDKGYAAYKAGDYAEATIVVPTVGPAPDAICGTKEPGLVDPRTAAENTARTITCGQSAAICQSTFIVISPAVLHPFPNVTVNVMQPQLV